MNGPAPYSNRDAEETEAIDTFRSLVDHTQVKLDIKERDKYPNIDGYIEIVNEARQPIAKLEAQVRKLPDDYGISPRLPCPISLIDYAKVTTSPVLFIGVDVNLKKAYWVPISEDLARGKELQRTVSVSFHENRVVDSKNTRYVIEWLWIAREYQMKLREHDRLVLALATLSRKARLAPGKITPSFREMHEFLDEMNGLLDGPFSLIKRRFYPGAWKVGLAYSDFSDSSVSYTLYPIRRDENDVQIKQFDARIDRELLSAHGIQGYFNENPIRMRPRQHAIEAIEERIEKIFQAKLLDHKGSEVLAREFIFALIDRFADEMGLVKKDDYRLAEIENGFYYHLPIWVDEAIKLMVRKRRNRTTKPADCLYGKRYFDPDMLRWQIMPEEMSQLEQLVVDRIKRRDPVPKIRVGYGKLPLGIFEEHHSFLISKGVTQIHRLYEPKDFSRIPKGGWIWATYSSETVEKNLNIFFTSLLSAYTNIIEQNFPQLKDKLQLFDGATRVIAVFNAKDRYVSEMDAPTIAFRYLKCKDESGLHIDLLKKGQMERDLETKLGKTPLGESIQLDGKTYELIGGPSEVLNFIYDDLPMLGFLYEELEEILRAYFGEMKKPD